jgi:hypothetical protein
VVVKIGNTDLLSTGRTVTQGKEQQPDKPGGGGTPAAPEHNIVTAINSLAEQYKASQEDRAKQDQETLDWTRRAGIGVGIYTLLTLGLTIISLCQLRTSRDNMFNEQRAWVILSEMKIVDQPDPTRIKFKYIFKNFGRSPTRGLHIDATFIETLNPGEESRRDAAIADFCNKGEIARKRNEGWSVTSIVPGSEYVWDQANVSDGLLVDLTKKSVLVGCIVYEQGLAAEKPSHSGFWAEVHYGESPPGIRGPYAHSPD